MKNNQVESRKLKIQIILGYLYRINPLDVWKAIAVLSDQTTFCLVLLALYAVLSALYAVLSALYAVLSPLYAVLSPLYAVVRALYAVVRALYAMVRALYAVLSPLYAVLSYISSIICGAFDYVDFQFSRFHLIVLHLFFKLY